MWPRPSLENWTLLDYTVIWRSATESYCFHRCVNGGRRRGAGEGTPVFGAWSFYRVELRGGYPSFWFVVLSRGGRQGVPQARTEYQSFPYLQGSRAVGRYDSCVHTAGLSCSPWPDVLCVTVMASLSAYSVTEPLGLTLGSQCALETV